MFDFINYTYSGMLSIVAAVFGIAYPHINNSIIQVDEKFHSTMITNRFKEKKIFSAFKFILIINLICIVLIPFLMDMSTHCYIFITIQTIATVALIFSFFYYTMKYNRSMMQVGYINKYGRILKKLIQKGKGYRTVL